LDVFLDALKTTGNPVGNKMVRDSNLDPIMRDGKNVTSTQLIARFFESNESLKTFQRVIKFVETYVPYFMSGHFVPDRSDLDNDDMLNKNISVYKTFKKFILDFITASKLLNEVINAIGSGYSVSPDMNRNWGNAIYGALPLLEAVETSVSIHESYPTLILSKGHEKKTMKVENYRRMAKGTAEIGNLILSVKSINQKLATKMGVAISTPKYPSKIKVDSNLQVPLFIILHNLIINAIKFSKLNKRGSNAFVKIEVDEDEKDGSTNIVVTDNGIGIKNIDLAAKGERERPDMASGLGEGLKTVYELARKNGITVGYKVPIIGGSKFTIHIKVPVDKPASHQDDDMEMFHSTPINPFVTDRSAQTSLKATFVASGWMISGISLFNPFPATSPLLLNFIPIQ